MNNTNYYYSQGFEFHRSISLVDFICTLNENKIVHGNRTKIYFKTGSTTEDFIKFTNSKIKIDSNKVLKPKRNLLLTSKILKFNNHDIKVQDLDARVINYIVAEEQDTALIEDEFSTSWVVNKLDADDNSKLESIILKSKYVSWDTYPTGEYYSYRFVNTGNALSKQDSKTSEIPTVTAKHNNPINFSTYTKWRLEYATVLLGFYEKLQEALPKYDIYMDSKPIKCMEKQNSRRMDINLQGFGNLDRHPHMYNHDLYQTKADLSIRIKTPDQLEYMHIKKKYQNYEILSDIPSFQVLDKIGLPWTNHIWWEPVKDNASLNQAKDDQGRVSLTLDIQCSIFFYEVEDEMFHTIDKLKVCFANFPEKPTFVYNLKNE